MWLAPIARPFLSYFFCFFVVKRKKRRRSTRKIPNLFSPFKSLLIYCCFLLFISKTFTLLTNAYSEVEKGRFFFIKIVKKKSIYFNLFSINIKKICELMLFWGGMTLSSTSNIKAQQFCNNNKISNKWCRARLLVFNVQSFQVLIESHFSLFVCCCFNCYTCTFAICVKVVVKRRQRIISLFFY